MSVKQWEILRHFCLIFLLHVSAHCEYNFGESALLRKLHADCSKQGIHVKLEFQKPFNGIAYSHGHHDKPKCQYISQNDADARSNQKNQTNFSFLIPIRGCGTVYFGGPAMRNINKEQENKNQVYIENTLSIQNDARIQEAGDLIKTLRCVWNKEIRHPLTASLPIGGLKLVPLKTVGEAQRVTYPSGKDGQGTRRRGQIQSVRLPIRRHQTRSLKEESDNDHTMVSSSKEKLSSPSSNAVKEEKPRLALALRSDANLHKGHFIVAHIVISVVLGTIMT